MRTQGSKTREDLRLAIEALPRPARVAMLSGIESAPIIAGAYANRDGICPMLAAHRAGGRSNIIGFALAWDRFAFGRCGRVHPASSHRARAAGAQGLPAGQPAGRPRAGG